MLYPTFANQKPFTLFTIITNAIYNNYTIEYIREYIDRKYTMNIVKIDINYVNLIRLEFAEMLINKGIPSDSEL